MLKVTEIAFSCYPVTDMAGARKFYEEILHLKPTITVGEAGGMQWTEYDIGAGTLSRQSADEFTEAATAQTDSAIVDGSGVPSVEVAHDVRLAAQNQVAKPAPVTITGCLDYDGKSAWLKETSGDVPRSRSWRSGFLKKRSPRIALVDGPTNASAYDGRRVSVTGVLIDREMRVNSVHPIEGECAP